MKFELEIDKEKKIFTSPFVPLLARRKYYEIMAKEEELEASGVALTSQQVIDGDDEMYSILTDVVFKGQFTIEQLMEGASKEYVDEKLTEAIFGIKKKEENEGNNQGE